MMKPGSRLRFTIGQWTALVAATAILLSLPHQKTTADSQFVGTFFALLPVAIIVSVLVDVLVGIPCPGCSRWTLRRLARARTYYCCAHCAGRYKRLGLGTWRDASGPEEDAIFRGKSRSRPWLGFAIPQDHGDSTTGRLLGNLRRRFQARMKPSESLGPLPLRAQTPGLSTQGDPSPDPVPPYESTGRLLRNRRKRSQAGNDH